MSSIRFNQDLAFTMEQVYIQNSINPAKGTNSLDHSDQTPNLTKVTKLSYRKEWITIAFTMTWGITSER